MLRGHNIDNEIEETRALVRKFQPRLMPLLKSAQEQTSNINLFAPIPPEDDCPICCLPLPYALAETAFFACCGATICCGCDEKKNTLSLMKHGKVDVTCAFCRAPTDHSIEALQKLCDQGRNAEAYNQLAIRFGTGSGVEKNAEKEFESRIKAAELGHPQSLGNIGMSYIFTCLVVLQPIGKAFCEVAAKKGSLLHREYLAKFGEAKYGRIDVAIKHWKVAASAGRQKSLDELMKVYRNGGLKKEELTRVLREFQAAKDAVKSPDRDEHLRRVKEEDDGGT